MALMYRESAFALKIMVEVVALQIAELPPLKLSLISSTILVFKHFLSVFHYLNQDGAEVHILSGAPPVEFVSYSCMFFSHICSASHPLPFGRGLPGGKVKFVPRLHVEKFICGSY